jgi:hypothetical protein
MGMAQVMLTHGKAKQVGRNGRPRLTGINRFGEAEEANSGAVTIGRFSPHGALLDGGLINDYRTIIAGAQDLLNNTNLPSLVTGTLPGEYTVEMPRRLARSIRQKNFLPEYPCRHGGNPHHSAIHRSLSMSAKLSLAKIAVSAANTVDRRAQ